MPISKVQKGDLVTSSAWNNMVDEINLKTNRAGDTFSGALTVADSLTVKNATGTGTVTVNNLTVTNKMNSLSVTAVAVDSLTVANKMSNLNVTTAAVDNLTVTNKMNSLSVATAAVDSLTVANKMSNLNVTTAAVDNLTVTNKMNSYSLSVATAAVDNLTVTNRMNSLAVGYLQVSGCISQNVSFYFYNGAGNTGRAAGVIDCSIYASNRIVASEFDAHSDVRIKQNLHRSNAAADLATLMQLKVTDYTMIDTVSKGNRVSKKLIAQEVAAVYPNAVSYTTGFIPNIYQLAQIENGFVTLSNPDLTIGDKVRLIFQDQEMELRVTEIAENGFSVANQPESKLPNGSVFVFGKEVNDFHSLDYDAIAMLNTSATQALVKQINGLESSHAALKTRFEALEMGLQKVHI